MTAPSMLDSQTPLTSRLLAGWIDDGACLGGQVFVWRDGAVLADFALGQSQPGRTATTRDVARYYCAVKPLTAGCLARAADEGLCDLDDPVRRYLPGYDAPDRSGVTLRGVLNHSCGLPDGPLDPYRVGFRDLAGVLGTMSLPASAWYPEPRYNDLISWCILATVVERIYTDEFPSVARRLLDTVDLTHRPDIRLTNPDADSFVQCHQLRAEEFRPVYEAEREVLFATVNPAHGGFGSARDLGLFYAELVRCLTGIGTMLSRASAQDMTRPQSLVEFGFGMGRLNYGLGFVVDAAKDALGTGWGSATFSHAGFVSRYRVVHGFADPQRRLAVAIRLFSVGAKNNWRFHRLGTALRADLDLESGKGGAP
jgi:CubicO group peptidase (beta-lactamase class C family)